MAKPRIESSNEIFIPTLASLHWALVLLWEDYPGIGFVEDSYKQGHPPKPIQRGCAEDRSELQHAVLGKFQAPLRPIKHPGEATIIYTGCQGCLSYTRGLSAPTIVQNLPKAPLASPNAKW